MTKLKDLVTCNCIWKRKKRRIFWKFLINLRYSDYNAIDNLCQFELNNWSMPFCLHFFFKVMQLCTKRAKLCLSILAKGLEYHVHFVSLYDANLLSFKSGTHDEQIISWIATPVHDSRFVLLTFPFFPNFFLLSPKSNLAATKWGYILLYFAIH